MKMTRKEAAKMYRYYRSVAKTINPDVTVFEKNNFARNNVSLLQGVAGKRKVVTL